jgi:biopolymer transport protein ExbB/TolQ
MESFGQTVSTALREIVGACQTPVIVVVLIAALVTLACLGSLVVELFTEHRRFKVFLPKLVDKLMQPGCDPRQVVEQSGLLLRQKRYLIELSRHPEISDTARESLAVGLRQREQGRYDGILKITQTLTVVGPMLGLLGTLIPLGPGITALGVGDTAMLSSSLLTAFDTTSMGLMMAFVTLVITAIRSRWYKQYMASFDAAMEWTLEVLATDERGEGDAATQGAL